MRIAIAGAGGRMGRSLIEATLNAEGLTLAAALELAGAPTLGSDAG
ncbi:MAG: 4-hydroxy-tetrahydrodipicolinate reductase, partial [Burkholderiales bacterium]